MEIPEQLLCSFSFFPPALLLPRPPIVSSSSSPSTLVSRRPIPCCCCCCCCFCCCCCNQRWSHIYQRDLFRGLRCRPFALQHHPRFSQRRGAPGSLVQGSQPPARLQLWRPILHGQALVRRSHLRPQDLLSGFQQSRPADHLQRWDGWRRHLPVQGGLPGNAHGDLQDHLEHRGGAQEARDFGWRWQRGDGNDRAVPVGEALDPGVPGGGGRTFAGSGLVEGWTGVGQRRRSINVSGCAAEHLGHQCLGQNLSQLLVWVQGYQQQCHGSTQVIRNIPYSIMCAYAIMAGFLKGYVSELNVTTG